MAISTLCPTHRRMDEQNVDAWEELTEELIPLWEFLSSTTLWKGGNISLFEGKKVPPAEAVQEIWNDLVHTLKGQFV